jgi:hypothetical protein
MERRSAPKTRIAALCAAVFLGACQVISGLNHLGESSDAGVAEDDGGGPPDVDPGGNPFADAGPLDVERPDIFVPDGSFLLHIVNGYPSIVGYGFPHVTSNPPAVDCSATDASLCAVALEAGLDIVLSATCPGDFSWGTDCVASSTNDCRLIMDSDKIVSVYCLRRH